MKNEPTGSSEESQNVDFKTGSAIADEYGSHPDMNGNEQQPLAQSNFDELYMYQRPSKKSIVNKIKKSGKEFSCKNAISYFFPILKWMKNYSWKEDLLHDVISGFTVAIMHIPQGMAYSMLGGVPPIVGIYMAFFPVLIYVLMGTSRHISMGTFAVVCMMTGKVVSEYSPQIQDGVDHSALEHNATENQSQMSGVHTSEEYTPLEVATCVCFVVGLWQLFLGLFKLGGLSVLLSDTLVSGFTTGAAIHVATSQVKHLFGIKVSHYSGPLKIIYTYVDLVKKIRTTNLIALAVSLPVIFLLAIYNELIKPVIGRKLPVPVPVELIAIVLGTLVSSYGNLRVDYNVTTVGNIPTGLPKPEAPPFDLILNVVVDGLIISIVSFSINMSMASLFARKLNYKINGNQELLASGTANIFGSFFSCLPFAASLSRSLIQKNTGGRTQIASIVSCSFLLLVLLWIGPFFEPLPQCVLAAIVVVSLKGMFSQIKDFKKIWCHSTSEGLIWLITLISVVVIDIDIGLGIGIFLSVVKLVSLGQKLKVVQLGNVPGTDIYLDVINYQAISHVILDMSCVAFMDPAAIKTLKSIYHDLKEKNVVLYLASCSASIREKMQHQEFFQDVHENHVFPFIHNAVMHAQHDNL